MTKSQHTNWRMFCGDGFADICVNDGHGRIARVFMRKSMTNNSEELKRHASLIAAAPDLLEACEFAKAQIKKGAHKKALPILRAAIKKAKP